MKQSLLALLLVSILSCHAVAQETASWNLSGDSIWTREPDTATLSRENGVYHIKHTGSRDWAVVLHPYIPVTPGEMFRISFKVANEGSGEVAYT
ncbi:MAG: hypothetical protein FWE95_04800, partial [Planctomycetaceae bacterium]|nr:hypothetical protein [Planctomycetaceae bacterium]